MRRVAEGRYERVEDAAVGDRLVKRGQDAMARGPAEGFDIDGFVDAMRYG